jgi:hypothetical protein
MSNPLRKKDEKKQLREIFRGSDGQSYRRVENSVTGDVRWEVLNTWTEQAKWTPVKVRQDRTLNSSALEKAYSDDPPSALNPESIETGGSREYEFFQIDGHPGEFRRVTTINGNHEFEARMDLDPKAGGEYRHVDNRSDVEYSEAELKEAWKEI